MMSLVLLGCCTSALLAPNHLPLAAQRAPRSVVRAALFDQRDLVVGEEWEGLISKITEYGCFVKMGHEGHMGLVHIRTLAQERLEREIIPEWIEETVGPVGSKVMVEVQSLKFKGEKRISLRLLDVIKKQHMDDLVFAPGPRRQAEGWGDTEEEE